MIKITGLSKLYGQRKALNNINLTISEGEPTGLVGPNGAGKTTLFSTMCGFLKPSSGTVEILGVKPGHSSLFGKLAILPQDANLTKGVSVFNHLFFFAQLQGFTKLEAKKQALEALNLVGLEESKGQSAEALSHGMLKRIGIAQTLIGSPSIVFLDEPTAGLDPNSASVIRDLIKSRSKHCKYIVSSHNLSDIEDTCSDIVILTKGEVTEHSQVSKMVERSQTLTFQFEQDVPANIGTLLSVSELITEVGISELDPKQLTVRFDANFETEVQVEVLQLLKSNSLEFKGMSRGKTLENHVRQVTQS